MKFIIHLMLIGGFLLTTGCTKNRGENAGTTTQKKDTTPVQNVQKPIYNEEEASAFIRQWIDSSAVVPDLPKINPEQVAPDLAAFYISRDFAPAWGINAAQALIESIDRLDQEGLESADFPKDLLVTLLDSLRQETATARTAARLEVLFSATYLKLADRLATGKVKPSQLSNSWHIRNETPDSLYRHLQQAVAGQVSASLDSLRPGFGQYSRLRRQLSTYRQLVQQGGWPDIDQGPQLAPGDSGTRVAAIRERLYATGDLTVAPARWQRPALYDSSLIAAVNTYQQRNGLEVRPEITDQMVEAMNIPAEERLKQIMLNMDRLRWISTGTMPGTYVMVNVPEFRLHVVEGGKEIKLMKVIVGKVLNFTPVFSDRIEYVEFSPYWNVPNSIASKELWPKIRRSSSYLNRNHYEILDGWGANAQVVSRSQVNWGNLDNYRIRQKPGPWNALGQVKFMFPNQYAIYLHDTPSEHLFDETYRAYSHGCIRIEEPAWFADWLFPQFDRGEIEEKMANRQWEQVPLDQEVPVYIIYLTAFEDKAGRMNFRQDLYGMDERLMDAFGEIE